MHWKFLPSSLEKSFNPLQKNAMDEDFNLYSFYTSLFLLLKVTWSQNVFMESSIFQNTYHQKNLIDFCPESLFRLGMLCTHLNRVALRRIKTNRIYLVYKTFKGRNLSIFFRGILENQWFHKSILTLSDL